MKRNKIKIVDSLTFKGMDSLKSLKMQRNGITKLMDGAFFGLNSMEELWVQYNSLSFEVACSSVSINKCKIFESSNNCMCKNAHI